VQSLDRRYSARVDFRTVSSGPTHRFAGVRNVLVCLYLGTPDQRPLEERVPWIESTLEKHRGFGVLVVVDERTNGILPGAKFREVSRQQADRFAGRILFSASVIEGKGVQHTLVRTFLRSLALVSARELPLRFFDTVPPAALWAAQRAQNDAGPSASDLERAVEVLRR
jgi:hypothetical protein